jgi:DNA-binding NarL/FixJ family response regulator
MPMSEKIRVLCVDDHAVMRDGISYALQTQADMELVGEAATGEEGLKLFRQLRPDVTLMDLQLPGMNGIKTIEAIRASFPRARIIVLTTYSGDIQAHRALTAGAAGYLLKHMLRTELLGTIRKVHAGGRYVPPQIASNLAEHIGEEPLSEREIEVLRCVSGGNSNKAVAEELSISEDTVKGHIKNILSKLGANDRTHAVTLAVSRGFLDPDE